MDEIPNGFTGFSQRTPGFESASDAIRKAEVDAAWAVANPEAARVAAARAANAGWQAQLKDLPRLDELNAWGLTSSQASAADDIGRYVNDIRFGSAHDRRFDIAKISSIPETDRRWAWMEVDMTAIRNNVAAIKKHVGSGVKIMAVVKADAYGHGAVQCAKTAINSGADYLGVATVDEGIELREAHINAPILILAEPPASSIPLLLAYKIMPSVYTSEFAVRYAEAADLMGILAPYHLKLNTGMNRIGVRYDEAVEFMRQIAFHRALELKGVFTHFATADCPETLDFQMQLRRFNEAIEAMRLAGFDPGMVHAANSAAIIRYPETHFDMVRLGISLYGYLPYPEAEGIVDLKPAMSIHARITDVKSVPMSEGVSYGLHYRSPGSVCICTIPLGYADGLWRGLSGRIDVLTGGMLYRQVGNICMDQCMFEVDLRSSASRMGQAPHIGDEVIVAGGNNGLAVTIDEIALLMDTLPHEVTIGFSKRLPRVYT